MARHGVLKAATISFLIVGLLPFGDIVVQCVRTAVLDIDEDEGTANDTRSDPVVSLAAGGAQRMSRPDRVASLHRRTAEDVERSSRDVLRPVKRAMELPWEPADDLELKKHLDLALHNPSAQKRKPKRKGAPSKTDRRNFSNTSTSLLNLAVQEHQLGGRAPVVYVLPSSNLPAEHIRHGQSCPYDSSLGGVGCSLGCSCRFWERCYVLSAEVSHGSEKNNTSLAERREKIGVCGIVPAGLVSISLVFFSGVLFIVVALRLYLQYIAALKAAEDELLEAMGTLGGGSAKAPEVVASTKANAAT
jgi:hypothetical protein